MAEEVGVHDAEDVRDASELLAEREKLISLDHTLRHNTSREFEFEMMSCAPDRQPTHVLPAYILDGICERLSGRIYDIEGLLKENYLLNLTPYRS